MRLRSSGLLVLAALAAAPVVVAQTPGRERIAPPALAARLGLMPMLTTGVPSFRTAFPDYDGRGVVIGILDSGLDPSIAGLLTTTTGEPKILDLRDFSGEGRLPLAEVAPEADAVVVGGQQLAGAAAWRAKSPGPWYAGVLRERPLGEMPAADLNGDGDDLDALPVLALRLDGAWAVLVDRDGDGSLAGEVPVRDYLVAREHFGWAPKGGTPPLALAVNFADVPGETMPALDLYFDTSAHGSHVAGIAAGHAIYGVTGFDGVAPGAWLLGLKISDNAQGGITTTGSMVRAIAYAVRFAKDRRLPLVLNMSFGVGNEQEGRARIDAVIDSVLAANPELVFTISAGNDGPGLSTLGFPGSAERAISVGATMPAIFRQAGQDGPPGPGALQEPIASFSGRGGELAKPDLVTPGVAYSTVPAWNTGDEVKGGTSMAAPHAAGLAARLVSGLVQRGLPVEAARIRLALQVAARAVPGAELPDEGAGRPDLLRAWNWLVAARAVEPLRVRLNGGALGTSALLRRAAPLTADTTISFTLRRGTGEGPRELRLEPTVPWLAAPASVTITDAEVTVPVTIRPGPARGSAAGAVRVRAAADTGAGVLARLGVTLLFPADTAATTLEAGVNGLARVGIPIEHGRSTLVRIAPEGEPGGADLHFFEPDGQPWRDGQTQPLEDESFAVFELQGRDAEDGLHELVLRGADAGPSKALVHVHAAPARVAGLAAAGSGAVLTLGDAVGKVPAPTLQLIGAEWRFPVEARGGLARRTPIALPDWATRVVVDVVMPRAQWSRFTDFGVTLFDAEGRQLGKEPMNYPRVRLAVRELPPAAPGRTITLGLFPGLAEPDDAGGWTAEVIVRFYGEEPAGALRPAAALPKLPDGSLRWRFTLPATRRTLPADALPLARVLLEQGALRWADEVVVTPAVRRAPAPAPAVRRPAAKRTTP